MAGFREHRLRLPTSPLRGHGVGDQNAAMAPRHSRRRSPGQALGIWGEEGGQQLAGRGSGDWRGRAFSELGSRKRTPSGRSPLNQMPGLLSLLARLALHPVDPRNCLSPPRSRVGWGCFLGFPLLLPHSQLEGGTKGGEVWILPKHPKPRLPQPPIIWPPGPGWASSGPESWKWVPVPTLLVPGR